MRENPDLDWRGYRRFRQSLLCQRRREDTCLGFAGEASRPREIAASQNILSII
jgi:hypothetical protein